MGRHCLAMVRRQALRYQFHFRMTATSSSIILQLPIEISQAEPGKARGTGAIAAPIQPMTGKARISGPGIAPAQRNQLAISGESIPAPTLTGPAGGYAQKYRGGHARSAGLQQPAHNTAIHPTRLGSAYTPTNWPTTPTPG